MLKQWYCEDTIHQELTYRMDKEELIKSVQYQTVVREQVDGTPRR